MQRITLLAASVLVLILLLNACSSDRPAATAVPSQSVSPDTSVPSSSPAASSVPEATIQSPPAPTVHPTGQVLSCDPSRDLHPTRDGLGDPYFPQLGNGGYDVQHYTLNIKVDLQNNRLDAQTTIDATATQDLTSFSLDFKGLDVQAVNVGGVPAQFTRQDMELVITPIQPVKRGQPFQVAVRYQGTPGTIDDQGMTLGWNKYDGGIYVASEPNGAMTWYPVNDHPCDKATYTFEITVPKPYEVAANGVLKQTKDNGGTSTYVWEEDHPMASYLVTVDIAQFTEQVQKSPDGVVVRNFFDKGLQDKVGKYFNLTPDIIQFYDSIFGPYPFDAYGVVVVGANFGFALETQTLSLFGQDSLGNEDRAAVVPAHELSHQWFGDSVSLKTWKDIWLNEGFATYSSWLWLEHKYSRRVLDEQARYWYGQIAASQDPPPGSPSPESLFSISVYFRGALTLHALRLKVGDEVFFKILRGFYSRYQYGNAGTQDFISLAEAISGQDLKDFFQGWLYEQKMPVITEMGLSN